MPDRIETRALRKLREAREVLATAEAGEASAREDVERIEGSVKTATAWRKECAAKLKAFGEPPEADPSTGRTTGKPWTRWRRRPATGGN